MNKSIFCAALAAAIFWSPFACAQEDLLNQTTVDLSDCKKTEILKIDHFTGMPDKGGVLKSYSVTFPEFEKLIYFGSDGNNKAGIVPSNRSHLWVLDSNYKVLNQAVVKKNAGSFHGVATKEGTFTVLKLKNGKYMALLPLVGEYSIGYFKFEENKKPQLNITTLGTAKVDDEVPVVAFSVADNLYQATYDVWNAVVHSDLKGVMAKMRYEKSYPEYFNYLGWCSWEEYRDQINEQNMTQAMKNIYKSGLPIRWVIIDEGPQWYQGDRKNRFKAGLYSFDPNPKKFPNGLAPIMKYKKEDGIKWMGIWHHQGGLYRGIDPNNIMGEELNKYFTTVKNNTYRAKGDSVSQYKFFEALFGYTIKDGFDFVKVDFQGPQFLSYVGTDNAVYAHSKTNRALEAVCEDNNLDLLNCFAQDIVCALNSKHSTVTLVSQDYRQDKPTAARIQIQQCNNNKLWIGQVVYGDHDMFHSNDLRCNRLMAVSKALSGGPVYVSDAPEKFVKEVITPLCYKDGKLLRPLAPSVPLQESLFACVMNEKELYKVIAPLDNGAASIVCYNLYDKAENTVISGSISKNDYKSASAMIQPYPGEWSLPAEGLVVYDYYDKKVSKLDDKYPVTLKGLSDKLLHLCPVNHGWAVIGDVTKYLSPSTVSQISATANQLRFKIKEGGDFYFWMENGKPQCQQGVCKSVAKGLWSLKLDDKFSGKEIVISKK